MDEQVERHESKQDVFEDALDELRYAISLAKEPVAAEDLSGDELLNDLRARYAAAYKPAGVSEKVVVSEEEAEKLREVATGEKTLFGLLVGIDEGNYDRIVRAYVNGWTVEKPKRYVVYQILPGSHIGDDAIQAIKHTDNTSAVAWMFAESANLGKFSDRLFTDAEIKHYGLQDCEKE